ncbi:hypothetical protein AWE51_04740 [Aquimarina aggregata]|uniref:histidine kinase n=1 Tax=Aquimarina aggregata TaxID=1642818 RepID=A0A162FAA7_9FLAO|nr:sensor histidine kinase [Aquimarina aggregata]KZS40266.1 hypothetical protein AWE51_04740 [Aquimarina aggregata]
MKQKEDYLLNFFVKSEVFFKTIFLLLGLVTSAQKVSQKFTHYGKEEGLSQSSVNFIYQDSRDYLWVANFGGINKFDGYNFTSYSNEFGDSSSIADNAVWTILECKDQTLWFGTKMGLSKFNFEENNFKNYLIRKQNKTLGNLAVKTLFEDQKGRFYVGSEGEGLYIFSKEKETFTLVEELPSTAKITAVTEDVLGNLWIGTENLGLFKISSDRSEVIAFFNIGSFNTKTIWSLHTDQNHNIWIGTDSDGLVKYNTNTNSFIFYKDQSEKFNYKGGNKIKSIEKGDDNYIWIGSATKGLSLYSYAENRFYNYNKDPYDSNSLYDNDVSSIFFGANNVLYVGFYTKGFDKVIQNPFQVLKNNPKISNSLSNNNVYCIYRDHNDILWFGTYGGGLNRYDPQTQKFDHFKNEENNPSSLSHDWVRIIYEDRANTMWIGTWGGGLNKFNKKTGTFKRYLPQSGENNELSHNIITAIFEDKDGELWIGTYGGGINIYQPETDDFISIVHDKKNDDSLSDDHITSFYQDKKGIIWVCTYGGGLNAYDKSTRKFERFLPDIEKDFSLNDHKILHIYDEQDKDFFWITTLGGGINKFYYKEKKFINYTEKDGLSNNSTMGMLQDDNERYWISSNNGLSHFDPENETFVNYTIKDGLVGDDYNLEAYAKTNDGVFYFGGKNGITYFKPKEIESNVAFPKINFTKVKINDSVYFKIPERLNIPFESHATFEFAAINPDKPSKINYAYQLIGYDQDWRYLNKNRYLEFTNLNPGSYELRIKSTDSNTLWNENYTSISLHIPTPWYMTWYFKSSLILILVLATYSYYRIKLNRAERRNQLLERKVNERTKTIQQKNIALSKEKDKTEDAYTKLKKLENFKNEFTGMLAHDLKNPLVTILGYSSDASDNPNLKSINKSGKTMLNLIENMLEVQKFESTDVQLNMNTCNLRRVILEGTDHVNLLASEKRIQINNTVDEIYSVNIDRDVIERVFINLLTNAIKFSKSDEYIEISAKVEDKNPSKIIVCVKDNGSGIPKHLLSFIFNKFSQIDAKDSGVAQSTGLGLSFCKMAIEAHGGEIWVTSEINRGSSFFITLQRTSDSIVAENQTNTNNNAYSNPMHRLNLEEKDFNLLNSFTEKINTLTIYEMGEWLDIFDKLSAHETDNVRKWRDMMMEALTSFDEKAFLYLKEKVLNTSLK